MKKLLFSITLLFGGSVMALTEKKKTLCDVAACMAHGDLKRLEGAFEMAYVAGWTTRELKVVPGSVSGN